MTPESRKKVKDTALDFAVPTGGADLRFLALQQGSSISYLFSHCFFFFLIMLENSALASWKFSSPMTNSSMESFPNTSPSSQSLPPPNQKIPLKTSVHFPITITIRKHWAKFVSCSPSHGYCGGVSIPQRHIYKVFRLRWIKWLSHNFDQNEICILINCN